MKHISDTIKESIIKKALGKKGAIIQAIARENNVGFSSVKKWMKEHQSRRLNPTNSTHKSLSRTDRLEHILATASLDERALGVYCRERGLYAVQLTEWKNEIMTDTDEEKHQALLSENKALRIEIKELKKQATGLITESGGIQKQITAEDGHKQAPGARSLHRCRINRSVRARLGMPRWAPPDLAALSAAAAAAKRMRSGALIPRASAAAYAP